MSIELEARFLVERLRNFESENMTDSMFREWNGHVTPSIARLEQMLESRIATVPEGWKVKALNDSGVYGYQISSPRINGVRSNTSVWEGSEDPAELMLYLMLASRKGVES